MKTTSLNVYARSIDLDFFRVKWLFQFRRL